MEQEKKETILDAATRAFARFGFKKASIEDIAKEAGVAKGTVYLACESKEDLYYQAVHREVRASGARSGWAAERSPASTWCSTGSSRRPARGSPFFVGR